jgi:alpha-N-arabinofuranosidase
MKNRREWLRQVSLSPAGAVIATSRMERDSTATVLIDPTPLFDISPHLYMQFTEPLGSTDASVEAAWDYATDNWRKDFVDVVRDLAPGAIRFGGNFSRYYKWREGVGPSNQRPWIRNYDWGGKETNRVGTHEFVSFCREVRAEPFYCVNFQADGIEWFRRTPEGDRAGTAVEAADWVSYANDPDNRERKAHGHAEPYDLKLWQIGNETSYVEAAFSKDEAIAHTISFAKAMRARDPRIELIGWGDEGRRSRQLWAGDLLKRAGEYLDYVAIHMMGQSPKRPDTLLSGLRYQADPHGAWQELLELSSAVETRIEELEDVLAAQKSKAGIAITEGHLSLKPHNINPILYEWISAVYHARCLNIYQRHGARVKIATAADFNGTRWTVMAVQMSIPDGNTFLLPVGSIMRLFSRYNGHQAVAAHSSNSSLDIAASRTKDRVILHVLNVDNKNSIAATFSVRGREVVGGRVWEISPPDLRTYVSQDQPDTFRPAEREMRVSVVPAWRFPAASVSVVELLLKPELQSLRF